MERNSNFMSTTFKNHSIYGGSSTSNNNSNKALIRDSWGNIGESSVVGGDLFSWPPRSYTCSFCKREFRSAQALGGHMNVHRRDRARLRSSPPRNGQFSIFNLNLDPNQNLNPNPNPNPNPNFLSSSSYSPSSILMFRQPFTSNLPPLASSPISNLSNSVPSEKLRWCRAKHSWVDHLSPHSGDNLANLKTTKALFEVGNFDGFLESGKESDDVVKKSEILRLNLEIGMLSDSKNDLDLELRLGYS